MANDVYFSFGASTSELELATALARAQVKSLTSDMNALAREMTKAGASADFDLGQRLNALGSQLSTAKGHMAELSSELRAHSAAAGGAAEEVRGLLGGFRQLTEGITGVHEAFSSAAETFAAAFAVREIAEWVSSATEAAEKVERLSAQLGASTDEVQMLGGVAKLTGTDFDQMVKSLERTQLRLRKVSLREQPDASRAGSARHQSEGIHPASDSGADRSYGISVSTICGRPNKNCSRDRDPRSRRGEPDSRPRPRTGGDPRARASHARIRRRHVEGNGRRARRDGRA